MIRDPLIVCFCFCLKLWQISEAAEDGAFDISAGKIVKESHPSGSAVLFSEVVINLASVKKMDDTANRSSCSYDIGN